MDSNTRYVVYFILTFCVFNILKLMELQNTSRDDIIIYTLLIILVISTYELKLKEKFTELADFVDCGCTNSKFDLTKKLCSLASVQTGNQFKQSCSVETMDNIAKTNTSKINTSEVNSSGVNTSGINSSEVNSSEVNSSGINTSGINTSEVNSSESKMIIGGIDYRDIKYDKNYDQRQLSVPSDYSSKPYEYGYSFMPPEKWFPCPTHQLTAKCEQPNNVMASLTSGYMTDLKDWNRAGRIMPPDDINIGFITERLNS